MPLEGLLLRDPPEGLAQLVPLVALALPALLVMLASLAPLNVSVVGVGAESVSAGGVRAARRRRPVPWLLGCMVGHKRRRNARMRV